MEKNAQEKKAALAKANQITTRLSEETVDAQTLISLVSLKQTLKSSKHINI
jgi:hypothetical protein